MGKLAKIITTGAIGKVTRPIVKFTTAHGPEILTGIAIGSSIASVMLAAKNAPKIHEIILGVRLDLDMIDEDDDEDEIKEQKKIIFVRAFKELTPLIAPIVAAETVAVVCMVGSNRLQHKEIVKLTAAIGGMNAAIEEFNIFRKEASKVVEPEKMEEVNKKVSEEVVKSKKEMEEKEPKENKEVSEEFEPKTGEKIYYDCWSGRRFSCNREKAEMAVKLLENQYRSLEDDEVVTLNDWYRIVGLPTTDAGDMIGWTKTDERQNTYFSAYIYSRQREDKDGDYEFVGYIDIAPSPKVLVD